MESFRRNSQIVNGASEGTGHGRRRTNPPPSTRRRIHSPPSARDCPEQSHCPRAAAQNKANLACGGTEAQREPGTTWPGRAEQSQFDEAPGSSQKAAGNHMAGRAKQSQFVFPGGSAPLRKWFRSRRAKQSQFRLAGADPLARKCCLEKELRERNAACASARKQSQFTLVGLLVVSR